MSTRRDALLADLGYNRKQYERIEWDLATIKYRIGHVQRELAKIEQEEMSQFDVD